MRKSFTTGTIRSWSRRGPLAGLVALTFFAAACGGGGGGGGAAPPGGGAPAAEDVPQDAISVTANTQQNPLPAGTPGVGKPAVIIGSKNFSEQTLLGELCSQALRAKGYTVNLKASIGGSELIDTSLQSNQVQMYPEYLGEIVTSVAKQPAPTSASDTYQKAKAFEESKRGSTLLLQTPFEDTDTIAVNNQVAQQYGLQTVADLAKIGPGGQGVTIAGPTEFSTRDTGLLGVKAQYNLPSVGYLSVQSGTQYQALDQNAANAANAFSTDYQLTSGKYTVLADPKGVFGYQYVAPVVKQEVLAAQGPEFAATLNWVSSLLSTKAIQALNQQVQGNGANPASVAQQFLAANGLK